MTITMKKDLQSVGFNLKRDKTYAIVAYGENVIYVLDEDRQKVGLDPSIEEEYFKYNE